MPPPIQQLDDLTSTRLRLERGEFGFLPAGEMKKDPGSQYIMASFCYSMFNEAALVKVLMVSIMRPTL